MFVYQFSRLLPHPLLIINNIYTSDPPLTIRLQSEVVVIEVTPWM